MAADSDSGTSHNDDVLSLHSSDNPGMKLVGEVFDGNGYNNWKKSMLISLSAKNKLCFIDGPLPRPSTSTDSAKAWQRCNDMVFSWILNSLSREIARSVLYCDSARPVWLELEERYNQSNGAQLFGIHKNLTEIGQGTDNIIGYFIRIKLVWDEIDSLGMNVGCSCSCSCGGKEKQEKFKLDQRVVQFLMGLNDSYTVMRGGMLMQNPLPSIASA